MIIVSIGAHHQLFGHDIDTEAIYRGALVSTAIAVPVAALLGRAVEDDSAWNTLLILVVFAAFALGGAVAGRMQPSTPAIHGALAAVPCLVVLTGVRIALTVLGDTELGLAIIIAQFAIGTTMGMLGGVIGARRANGGRSANGRSLLS